jgi:hypothetical protein
MEQICPCQERGALRSSLTIQATTDFKSQGRACRGWLFELVPNTEGNSVSKESRISILCTHYPISALLTPF